MKKIITLLLLLCYCSLFGQSKRDKNWIMGYDLPINGQPSSEEYGGIQIKFEKDLLQLSTFNIPTLGVSGCANDEDGNLQFYTSGCTIYHKNNEIMENGDDITFGQMVEIQRCIKDKSILNMLSSTVILPIPNHPDQYLVFQLGQNQPENSEIVIDKSLYAQVDMTANNGLGKVVTKHQIAIEDSLHDAVAAVRHGNGRDWWVLIPRGTERQFWEMRITPQGLAAEKILRTLPPQDKFNITVEGDDPNHPILLNEYSFEYWAGQAIFSPDGSKYARIVMGNGVEIFDFDRCTGAMHLLRTIPMPPDSNFLAAGVPIQGCGLAFSPNSRYLYFSNNLALFQLDACMENIKTGDYQKIDYYDGYLSNGQLSTNFFQMRNGPDGKIYINSTNGTRELHVIESPNRAGKACNFKQHALLLPKWNYLMGNYFPNFNLYDVADSPCDSLGIDDPNPVIPPLTFDTFTIYPNPANQAVNLYIPRCEGAKIDIWNISGQLVLENLSVTGDETFTLPTKDWAAGIYILAAYLDAKKPEIRKIMVTH
jgi:hypothetical protein